MMQCPLGVSNARQEDVKDLIRRPRARKKKKKKKIMSRKKLRMNEKKC